jgi:hypothetical protein
MSITRKELRRNIAVRTQQPFFRTMDAATGDVTSTGGTTLTVIDTANLKQVDDYWNGDFVYAPVADEVRQISDFDNATSTATFLEAATTMNGVVYEIWSQWTPHEVHAAINQAIRDAWPFFFDGKQGYIVLQAGQGTKYTLANVLTDETTGVLETVMPRFINTAEMEVLASSIKGTADAGGGNDELVDATTDFAAKGVNDEWEVRIYDGTGAGQRRVVSSVATTTITVGANWATNPDATSKYNVVKVGDETHGYKFQRAWSVDRVDNPLEFRLGSHSYGYEGHVIRLKYETEYQPLTADTSTTECPQEYLELAALARLYLIKMTNISATEVKNWEGAQKAFAEAAQQYADKNRFQHHSTSYLDDQDMTVRLSNEYPF